MSIKGSENNHKNLQKIDVHVHLGKYAGSFINTSYEPELIKVFKSHGYKKIIFIHNSFFFNLEKGLKNTLAYILQHKDFAYGYLVYNPHFVEQSINIIRENFSKNNLIGVKIHPEDHQCYIIDERYEPLWEIATEKGIPILSHTWNPNVANQTQKYADVLLFEPVIKKYPKLKIILGHAGAKDYYYKEVIKMLKRYRENQVYVDIAGDIFYRNMLEEFAEGVGAEKILFGTDAPWVDPAFTISYLESSNLTALNKASVFYDNAANLFCI